MSTDEPREQEPKIADEGRGPEARADAAPIFYVGIGASAGGLEALDAFFGAMPSRSGLAFVVIQHLSPDYKSLMVELLSKRTEMIVRRAEDGLAVEADTIYLIPPKKQLTIFHGKLVLSDQDHQRGLNLPIDTFLRSLAEDQGERAIGVILSGTGSDGMRGIRSIKEAGGVVFAQDPESARFDGMPRAALSTGLVDFTLKPEDMPAQLGALLRPAQGRRAGALPDVSTDDEAMNRLFAALRDRTKVDFTHYKTSTVMRRIERRMVVAQIPSLTEYSRHVERHPSEAGALYRELLIGVTSFFRDPPAWDQLASNWMPQLLRNATRRELRFWIAGCSTGEEAYSLAITARECLERLQIDREVKIFATDIDRDAIVVAGAGVYAESLAADVPPAILAKYFHHRGGGIEVARSIREMVVFAQHNLVRDPPFTHVHLVSCRNLLIYLQPLLQQRALEMFNFALEPDGLLMLGTSETVGDLGDCFEPLDHKWKIFRSLGRRRPPSDWSDTGRAAPNPYRAGRLIGAGRPGPRPHEEERMLERLLEGAVGDYLPLSLIVNEQLEVLHVVGQAEGFLRIPAGKLQNDVSKMAAPDLAIPIATAIQKAFASRTEFRYTGVHITGPSGTRLIELRVKPLPERKGQEHLVAVFIVEKTPKGPEGAASGTTYDLTVEAGNRIKDLEQELQFVRENLQATIEELETANEELQATNEELLASNEELQATNEELQSVNEELHTVNAEYQRKIMELTELHNDVENLLAGAMVGNVIVDENLEIRKFSPQITRLLHIKQTDIGRSIARIDHTLRDVDLADLVARIQRSRQPIEREVTSTEGATFLLRALPYMVGPGHVSGVLFAFEAVAPEPPHKS